MYADLNGKTLDQFKAMWQERNAPTVTTGVYSSRTSGLCTHCKGAFDRTGHHLGNPSFFAHGIRHGFGLHRFATAEGWDKTVYTHATYEIGPRGITATVDDGQMFQELDQHMDSDLAQMVVAWVSDQLGGN